MMNQNSIWKQLKFVTGNAHKLREAQEILGIDLEQQALDHLHEIQTADVRQLVEHKAEQAWQELQCPVMVEDSGLIFTAWNGLPGALIKWFENSVGCAGMLKMLKAFDNREATAQCLVAVHDGEKIRVAEGKVRGVIAGELRGDNGFGWDVMFIPEGHTRTYAEMSFQEKNAISHRRLAFEALKGML